MVITADDDKIYAQTMIAYLINSYKCFSGAVLARNVRIILRSVEMLEQYNKWEGEKYLDEYIDVSRIDLCAIGAGEYVIRRR